MSETLDTFIPKKSPGFEAVTISLQTLSNCDLELIIVAIRGNPIASSRHDREDLRPQRRAACAANASRTRCAAAATGCAEQPTKHYERKQGRATAARKQEQTQKHAEGRSQAQAAQSCTLRTDSVRGCGRDG